MLHELTPGPGGKVLCSYCNAQRPIQNTLEIDTGAFFPTTTKVMPTQPQGMGRFQSYVALMKPVMPALVVSRRV